MLIERETGEVVLFLNGMHYRPSDLLHDRTTTAREYVEGMSCAPEYEDMRERFLASKHQWSNRRRLQPRPIKQSLGVRVTPEVKARLFELAEAEGRTASDVAAEVITRYIKAKESVA